MKVEEIDLVEYRIFLYNHTDNLFETKIVGYEQSLFLGLRANLNPDRKLRLYIVKLTDEEVKVINDSFNTYEDSVVFQHLLELGAR